MCIRDRFVRVTVVEQPEPRQRIDKVDNLNRTVGVVHLQHRGINLLMLFFIEIFRLEENNLVELFRVQQHSAEQSLLGLLRMREMCIRDSVRAHQ